MKIYLFNQKDNIKKRISFKNLIKNIYKIAISKNNYIILIEINNSNLQIHPFDVFVDCRLYEIDTEKYLKFKIKKFINQLKKTNYEN